MKWSSTYTPFLPGCYVKRRRPSHTVARVTRANSKPRAAAQIPIHFPTGHPVVEYQLKPKPKGTA